MWNVRTALASVYTALALSSALPGYAQEATVTNPDPAVGAIKQEQLDREEQLSNSAPAKAEVKSGLPPGGAVLSAPSQKRRAALESSKIITDQERKTIAAVTPEGRPTIAIALGGGGARGAAHIGILRVFQREKIPIDYIVGNSMGAIVGGLYASGLTLDRISGLAEDGSLRHAYMPTAIVPKVLAYPLSKLSLHPHYAGLFSGKRFTKYLQSVLPDSDMNVQQTQIPFCAVATNLIDGKAYTLNEGSLATAMKASSAISPILQPVAIGDRLFVDGGVRANMPIRAARETGAGIVIAVLVDEPLVPVPAKRFQHMKGLATRLADIVLAASDERQLEYADVVINPDVSNIQILSKNPADADRAIKVGEEAAEKALPAIRRLLNQPPKHSRVAGTPEQMQ